MSITSLTARVKPKYKLILLGDQMVGKTCLIERFVNDKFEDSETPTVGIDFVVTNIQHNGKMYRLQLWDTAGQERFKSLIPSYLKDSHCVLILYDVANKESSKNVFKWLEMYREHVDQSSIAIVIGNKIDLKSRFPNFEAMPQLCKERGLPHFEVSAKSGKNVKEMFNSIIDLILEKTNKPILDEKLLENNTVIETDAKIEVDSEQPSNSAVKLTNISFHSEKSQGKSLAGKKTKNNCC